jgi:serine/threonine protein kinase
MKTETLERILAFAELPYTVHDLLRCSGQRTVYLGTNTDTDAPIVLKICNYAEIRVARIQREIKILQGFDTHYFPKVEKHAYITKETLRYFFDSFDPRDDGALIAELQAEGLRPFFLTVEEYIEHQAWADIQDVLKQEAVLVAFMTDVFRALRMLWKAKIVHRDLKPDNILVRPDMTPTLIDLGIAKSFSEGTLNLTAFGFRSPCTPEYASPRYNRKLWMR